MPRKKLGTTIWISPKCKKKLAWFGKKGDTYENIIEKLMGKKKK